MKTSKCFPPAVLHEIRSQKMNPLPIKPVYLMNTK